MRILSSRFQPAPEDHVEEQGGADDASEEAGSDIPNQNAGDNPNPDSGEEDYTIVPLESLSPLPPLQHNVPFEKTKFSVKPSLTSMGVAQKFVTPLLEEYIKEKVPRLKWLLKVPSVGNFNGVVFNQIIRNKLRTERSDEMWFHLNNMPFRLSKKEFVLISGLNVRKTYTDLQLKVRVKDTSFVDKHFPGQKMVDRKDAMRVLEEYKKRNIKRLDRKVHKKVMARLLLGCLIYNYLGNGNGKGLEKKYWCIIADLDFCNSYDWGNFVWDALKRAFDTDPSKWNKNGLGYRTYLFPRLSFIIQAWIAESVPALRQALVARPEEVIEEKYPRILRWEWGSKRIDEDDREEDFDAVVEVIPTLVPSEAEEKQWYYEEYEFVGADITPDTMIDAIKSKLEGKVKIHRIAAARPSESQGIERGQPTDLPEPAAEERVEARDLPTERLGSPIGPQNCPPPEITAHTTTEKEDQTRRRQSSRDAFYSWSAKNEEKMNRRFQNIEEKIEQRFQNIEEKIEHQYEGIKNELCLVRDNELQQLKKLLKSSINALQQAQPHVIVNFEL